MIHTREFWREIERIFWMDSMTTVLLGNCRGDDGVFAFSREILFRTAGAWVADTLPRETCGQTYYLCTEDTPEIPGAVSVSCETENRYRTLAEQDAVFQGKDVLVIAAPMPELTRRDYLRLIGTHQTAGNDVTVLCCDGGVSERYAIVRDANDEFVTIAQGEGERALHAAIFRAPVLKKVLATGADWLYGAVNAAGRSGARMGVAHVGTVTEIVTGLDAYHVQKRLMERINFFHISRGVMIFAPEATYISPDAMIGTGTTILPGTMIKPGCRIGENVTLGPNTILEESEIGAGTSVNSSQVYESTVGTEATVGPFAYIRPGCHVGDHARIGDFVELKKAQIGDGTKVSHLTYIGDAEVGERVNFGCGTVVVNYDGYVKSKTVIGNDCFIGCNTNLVAPVSLGDRAFTAAGTTVTTDVPAGALSVGRARQKNIEGWNDRRRETHGQKNG